MSLFSELGALGNDILGGRYFPDPRVDRARAVVSEGERQLQGHLAYTRNLRTNAIALCVFATGVAVIARSDYTPIIALGTGLLAFAAHQAVSATEAALTQLQSLKNQHRL